jgi:hypothetical protein
VVPISALEKTKLIRSGPKTKLKKNGMDYVFDVCEHNCSCKRHKINAKTGHCHGVSSKYDIKLLDEKGKQISFGRINEGADSLEIANLIVQTFLRGDYGEDGVWFETLKRDCMESVRKNSSVATCNPQVALDNSQGPACETSTIGEMGKQLEQQSAQIQRQSVKIQQLEDGRKAFEQRLQDWQIQQKGQ